MSDDDRIRRYWDDRATEAGGAPTATTNDVWLRVLERRVLADELAAVDPAAAVVDLGCGDGQTVLALAGAHPGMSFVGIDYSEAMVEAARQALASAPAAVADRVEFGVGDVTDLQAALGGRRFDVAMTDRCLINLPTTEAQFGAIAGIAEVLRPGGTYLAIENFLDGQAALDRARAEVGLAPIGIRWHNRFFDEDELLARAAEWFDDADVFDFSSSYYLVTRVAYSALCAEEGTEPRYDHPLHRIAVSLPPAGRLSPIRLVRFRRSADAAEVAPG